MRRPARCLRARMWCRDHAYGVFRVLRHTFSVTAIQKGISLPALQHLLGHDHLATTEIYLNLSPEEVMREFREKW
jgi:site-specific recombinase XerD